MFDFIAKLVCLVIDWFKAEDIYYKPYKPNVLGEHKRSYKEEDWR